MIIHIEICDVCRRIVRGGGELTPVSAHGFSWDVGTCCQDKPFVVIEHACVYKNALLPRIEALIITELALNKKVL